MRAARLLGALALVVSAGASAWPTPAASPAPPSVFEERAPDPTAMPKSAPALRQGFITEYRGIAGNARRKVLAAWIPRLGVVEKLAEQDERAAQRACPEPRGKNAEVCQEATRNKLYGIRKTGLEYYFVGR